MDGPNTLIKLQSAEQLPADWDAQAVCLYQKKDFLLHCEVHNFCHQRYYLLKKAETIVAQAVVYSLPLDLFTFLRIKSPVTMQIAGLPVSVSSESLMGTERERLAKMLKTEEKGLLLVLNLTRALKTKSFINGTTLPTFETEIRWKDFGEYLSSMVSSYRRSHMMTLKKMADVLTEKTQCNVFDQEMYDLYEEVFAHSKDKLEKLSIEFFRHLPHPFFLTCFRNDGALLGWHISLLDKETFRFFLGGVNYALNEKYSTYLNILLDITRQGIESRAKKIEYGQTAQTTKSRLGPLLVRRYMAGSHSNSILNAMLRMVDGLLQYKTSKTVHRVFKFRGEDSP